MSAIMVLCSIFRTLRDSFISCIASQLSRSFWIKITFCFVSLWQRLSKAFDRVAAISDLASAES
jgi:hypothetical protein